MIFDFFKFLNKGVLGTTADLVASPKDDRDYLLSGVMPEIKRYPEEMPRAFDLTITNQGSSPHCAGYTGATIKQYMELKERHAVEPDGDWLYNEAKKIDGMPNVRGTFFRAILKILRDKGCKMKGMDNDPSIYRISEYRRVDDISFENLKKTLFVYGHTFAGWRGSNNGWRGEVIRPPYSFEQTWGHATALTHYFKNYIGGQNSWGENAHKGGLFKSPESYLPFEAWIVTVDKVNKPREEVKYGWVARFDYNTGRAYLKDNITTVNLNVRDEPGLGGKKITTLQAGTRVTPAEPDGSILKDRTLDGYTWTCILLD